MTTYKTLARVYCGAIANIPLHRECVRDAYMQYIKTLPYEIVALRDGTTLAYGGMNAGVECYTKKGIQSAIVKGGYDASFTVCNDATHDGIALCHNLPRSYGGTNDRYNVVVDCRVCNGIQRDQIVSECVSDWIHSKHVSFTYYETVKV